MATEEQKIAARHDPSYYRGAIAWSPDGRTIVADAGEYGKARQYSTLVAIPAGGGPERVITDQKWYFIYDLKWLSHGRGLIVQGAERAFDPAQIWYVPWARGPAERITNDLNNYSGLALAADSSAFVTVLSEKIEHMDCEPHRTALRFRLRPEARRWTDSPDWRGRLTGVSPMRPKPAGISTSGSCRQMVAPPGN